MHPQIIGILGIHWDPWGWFATAAANAVKLVMRLSLGVVEHSPEPNLTSAWYRGEYHLMLQIGAYATIAVALCATISAVLKGSLKDVIRIYTTGIPIAILGGIAAIAFVTILQKVDQDMTTAVLDHTRNYFDAFFAHLDQYGHHSENFGTAFIEFWIFLLLLVFTLVLWLELVFRQVMIYMGVLFIPLGLAAFVWPPVRSWFAGIIEVTATMVFSKFVIACVLAFGFLSINQGIHNTDSVGDAVTVFIAGMITTFVACFASPALIVFVMAPSHDIVTRRDVLPRTPFGADNSYGRGKIKNSLSQVGKRLGGRSPSRGLPGGRTSG